MAIFLGKGKDMKSTATTHETFTEFERRLARKFKVESRTVCQAGLDDLVQLTDVAFETEDQKSKVQLPTLEMNARKPKTHLEWKLAVQN